jgi:hypothetical protein
LLYIFWRAWGYVLFKLAFYSYEDSALVRYDGAAGWMVPEVSKKLNAFLFKVRGVLPRKIFSFQVALS